MTCFKQLSLVLLLVCWIGCAKQSPTETGKESPTTVSAEGSEEGSDEVKIQVLDFEGIGQLVKSHQGKVVVMDAWSTSCQPCVREFPNLVKLHQKHGPEKIACISLSFDYDGIDEVEVSKQRVLGFLRQQNAIFDNVISSEEDEALYKKFELAAVPAIFVYDQTGKLIKRFEGEPEQGELYDGVRELVNELMQDSPAESP